MNQKYIKLRRWNLKILKVEMMNAILSTEINKKHVLNYRRNIKNLGILFRKSRAKNKIHNLNMSHMGYWSNGRLIFLFELVMIFINWNSIILYFNYI